MKITAFYFLEIKMSSRARKTIDDELQKVEFETSEEVDVVPTFDSMGIREDLLRGIYAYGFEKPSAIQQRAIKQIIKGRDVIAQAQSGTGKTATFSISTLQVLDTSVRETQGNFSQKRIGHFAYKIFFLTEISTFLELTSSVW